MNSSIPLQVQNLQIPDQAAGYQRALTMNALLGQSDLQKIQLAHATRENTKAEALDNLAKSSNTMEEFLQGYAKLDPLGAQAAAINMRKLTLETQKTQGEVDKQGREGMSATANAILSASPEDRPAVYAQRRAMDIASGNPNAAKSPEVWNDSLLPHFMGNQAAGLSANDAMTRGDFRASVPQMPQPPMPAAPTTMAQYTQDGPPMPYAPSVSGTALGGGNGVVGGGAGFGATGSQAPGAAAPMQSPIDKSTWDKRADGSTKGTGFLGVMKRPDGRVSSEISIGVNIGGKEMEIPSMVPTLTQAEVNTLLTMGPNDRMPESIVNKAVEFAKGRLAKGQSVFAGDNESVSMQQTPPIDVAAKRPGITPDDYRKEAARLDGLGTKAASDHAKEYRAEADKLDERIWKERDSSQFFSELGITGNKLTGRFEKDGKPISSDEVRQLALDYAKAKAQNITVENYPNPITVTDQKTGQQKSIQFGKKGDYKEVPYAPASNDAERISAGFHDRMNAAEKIMGGIGEAGYPTVGATTAGKILGPTAGRMASSAEQQKYQQAQADWVRAKLRKESGAVIGPQEMQDEIDTYFPRLGDGPDVIAQKTQARVIAQDAMRRNAGPALQGKTPGEPGVSSSQVPPAASRQAGQVYTTPKGKLKWTGTGWVQP